MKPIVITGDAFTSTKIYGISRYSYEILKGIDEILTSENYDLDVRLCYPNDLNLSIEELKSIKLVPLDRQKHYRLSTLRNYIKKNKAISCNFANEIQLNRKGIVCVHDMRPLDVKGFDTRELYKEISLLRLSVVLMNSNIVTVSEYQKERISALCKIPQNKITVIPNGWEHIIKVESDENIFDKLHSVNKNQYYYTVSSVAKHKNFKWIYEVAKKNKNNIFVVAGNIDSKCWGTDISDYKLPNVIFCGYVTDEENVALLKNCKAFLFPSLYEGFGIPPLEALALGKRIIVSNATCLPEIFKKSASYFDPFDYTVDLESLINEKVDSPYEILEKYSWKKSAKLWVELFMKMQD